MYLDREYLALVGGLFNEGETSIECAKRELLEETGLGKRSLFMPWQQRARSNKLGYFAKKCFLFSSLLYFHTIFLFF
jgi:8-oxo-dGTP pyrophosphatase MutT (NUDIX family)